MEQTFLDEFTFSIQDDYFYPVAEYTPATLNREHTYDDIEVALTTYTDWWEFIGRTDDRKRGSDALYRIEDEHYVWCSRTGLEQAGNVIRISQSAPEQLRFIVLSTLFERIANRKFKTNLEDDATREPITVSTPRSFSIKTELTEDEQTEYKTELSEATQKLLTRYSEVETISGLQDLISWYNSRRTELFREYTDFKPSVLSQVLNDFTIPSDWVGPEKPIDGGTDFTIIQYELGEKSFHESSTEGVLIVIDEVKKTVQLIHEVDFEDTVIKETSYQSVPELQEALTSFFSVSLQDCLSP